MKKKKYNNGGELFKNLGAMATYVNPAIGTGLSLFGTMLDQTQTNTINTNVQQNKNPYGMFKNGGQFNGFKQFNTVSHNQGGQSINTDGVPSGKGVAEVEKKENMIKYHNLPDKQGQQYIFSDKNKTAQKLKAIVKKYNKNYKADTDPITKTAIEFEAKELEAKNEIINQQKQEFSNGGKYPNGGPFGNPKLAGTLLEMADAGRTPAPTSLPALNNPVFSNTVSFPLNNQFSTPENAPIDYTNATDQGNNQSFVPQNNPTNPVDGTKLLTALGYGIKVANTFGKTDKDRMIMPNYQLSDARMNSLNANLTQARQEATGVSNVASNINKNAASSFSQYRNREMNNLGNLQDKFAQIAASEQELRNNIAGNQGQYELNKAFANQRIQDDNQIRNLQNKARKQDMQSAFAGDLLAEADRIAANENLKNIANATTAETMSILKTMFPDFGVDEELATALQQYSRGEISEADFNKIKSEKTLIKFK